MNFNINQITLWLESGKRQDLYFLPNKINVITGGSSTGKSTILKIIDYCLCKSTGNKIPQSIINENVKWYGINFTINDSTFTIARGKPVGSASSSDYFFSSTGVVPDLPTADIDETALKQILEEQFSIDSEFTFPYGGKVIRAGSKISFRYFLLFNTQSDIVINNEEQFFDKINSSRYREALDRIFWLALNSSTPRNVLVTEELSKQKRELLAIAKKETLFEKQRLVFHNNIFELVVRAQQAGLIESGLPTMQDSLEVLRGLVKNYLTTYNRESLKEIDELQQQRRDLLRKIRNIDVFENNYEEYKRLIANNVDSLQPVSVLRKGLAELILAPAVSEIFENLEVRLAKLKSELLRKKPFLTNLSQDRAKLESQVAEIDQQIKVLPTRSTDFVDEAHRLVLIGEIKAKLELYTQVADDLDFTAQKMAIESLIDQLQDEAKATSESQKITIDILQDNIQRYVSKSKALGQYRSYKAYFSESEKVLHLRRPNSVDLENVGSSSNYLFLHLCLFLGLHDFALRKSSRYIPQFMVWDQLSRPYYEEVKKRKPNVETYDDVADEDFVNDDRTKLSEAFKLFDDFITRANDEYKQNFQFIILEHVSPEFFDGMDMKNFHLVANFRDGNALIPLDEIKLPDESEPED